MTKKHFDGKYKTAGAIPTRALLFYFVGGDRQERKEAAVELLRRLAAYEKCLAEEDSNGKA